MNKIKKLRVALVANTTWNIYNFRQNVIEKLLENDCEVFVLAPIDAYIEYKEKFPTVTHLNLRTLDRDSTNPIKDMLLIEELRRKYKVIKPDLIIHYTHKPNIYGSIAAKLNGIKSVAVVTGLGYSFINKGFINSITEFLYKYTSKYHDIFIFENTDDKRLFIDKGLLEAKKAYSIKGCGVDINHYRSNGHVHTSNEPIVFTFIGRLLKDKGIEEFASAAAKIKSKYPSVKFVVLGDFDGENPSTIDRDELLTWINNETIDYKGFVNDVRPVIDASSCIVLPSYREGMPRIILEAMSMSKPIITTDTAGCRETVLEGKNGYLAKIKDEASLIHAMEKFINLAENERINMGKEGRILAETVFSDVTIANHIYDILFKESK